MFSHNLTRVISTRTEPIKLSKVKDVYRFVCVALDQSQSVRVVGIDRVTIMFWTSGATFVHTEDTQNNLLDWEH